MTDAPAHAVGGYDPAHFAKLAEVEDQHFWFCARRRVIAAILAPLVADLPEGYRVLEMGCGTGDVLRVLESVCARGRVVGADLYDEGLAVARQRVRCALVRTDMRRFAFDEPFDVVCVFDVIEHLEDDAAALRDLHRTTQSGGLLIVTVPAYMALWSYFDEAAGHCRRYTPRDLHQRITDAGFEVCHLTPFMCPLAPLMWLGRRVNRTHQPRHDLRIVPGVNALLKAALALERPALRRGAVLPWGTSLLAVARRP